MGRSVGEKAEQAVKNSQRVKGEAVTPEQNIKFLRDNLRAGLYVPSHQIQALLERYDLDHTLMVQNTNLLRDATATIEKLEAGEDA